MECPLKTLLEKTEAIVDWVHIHIEKRPVLSVPDALTTLKHLKGDCNEHSVLFAALARAAGIPTSIEIGLVYLEGRFYYHAWNAVYIGKWISVDTLFRQIPADVTHLRFAGDAKHSPLDTIGLIGKMDIQILELDG